MQSRGPVGRHSDIIQSCRGRGWQRDGAGKTEAIILQKRTGVRYIRKSGSFYPPTPLCGSRKVRCFSLCSHFFMELPSAYQAGKSPILSNKGAEKSGNGEKCIAFLQNFLPVPLPLRPLYYSKKALRGHRVAEKGLSASHRDTTEQRPAINGDKRAQNKNDRFTAKNWCSIHEKEGR